MLTEAVYQKYCKTCEHKYSVPTRNDQPITHVCLADFSSHLVRYTLYIKEEPGKSTTLAVPEQFIFPKNCPFTLEITIDDQIVSE